MLAGADPQPRWLPRRVLTVVSADVDTTAGVGAVWSVWRPKSERAREHTALLEWYDEQWRSLGGGITDGVHAGTGLCDVLEVRGCGGGLSLTRRLDPPRSIATAPWIGCVTLRLGPEVGHVLVGERRIDAPPGQRGLVAAWTSPHDSGRDRPVVVAFGRDGVELSRIGPYDALDTHTWARLREEL
ncbi:hypothetical protein [Actinacidiphila yeochonensis]|uniref:hypothetical protein n=1 Tax=Actinacidiphila yeochonensis TaxID=89050 RepID=UPI00055DC2A1|nr:hypothetical protein [Actinacidiphila yeochonensis]